MYREITTPLGISFDEGELLTRDIERAQREDDILALGEHINAQLVTNYFRQQGLNSHWVDARQVICIDSCFGARAILNVDEQPFDDDEADVYVIGGFYGANERGETVVLPRGGSDLTADYIAAALRASINILLKEEPGIRATNPLFVPDARVISKLTYREMRELCYGGNAVVQEEAMAQCRRAVVPIQVRSLASPENRGTMIVGGRDVTQQPLVGIATKEHGNFVLYTFKKGESPSYFVSLCNAFSIRGISIDMIATNDGLVSIAVDSEEITPQSAHTLLWELNFLGLREVRNGYSLVSIVGEGIQDPLTLREKILLLLGKRVAASYGPVLGGINVDTTTFYIETFGMNEERGVAMALAQCFADKAVPLAGISTTIDSISVGTEIQQTPAERDGLCEILEQRMHPDSITVTRNGLLLHGPSRTPSNITVAVPECEKGNVVRQLYKEFF